MPTPIGIEEQPTGQSVYLEDKDKVLSFSADMDEHDIGHNLRVSEYGEDPINSSAKYVWEVAKQPQSVLGRLKDSILTKVGLHPDKDEIGARAVISLNEIERVRISDITDEEKTKEISLIHDDIDKYLAGKGVYTRATENLRMNDFMLNVGILALSGGAISEFGAVAFAKGLFKYVVTSEVLRRGVFPAIKAISVPEGQDYEYKPLSLSDLIGIKTEEAGLKTATDIIEMGITGAIILTPKIIEHAKITAVVKEALPRLTDLFIEKGIKIPKEGLTVDYVAQMARQSPTLGTAILQAADALPFYKALGTRGEALIPSFKKGDTIKLPEGVAEVLRIEGEKIILGIAGKEIIKNIADLAKEIIPKIAKPEVTVPSELQPLAEEARKYKSAEEAIVSDWTDQRAMGGGEPYTYIKIGNKEYGRVVDAEAFMKPTDITIPEGIVAVRNDGTFVYNPKNKSGVFDTAKEAEDALIKDATDFYNQAIAKPEVTAPVEKPSIPPVKPPLASEIKQQRGFVTSIQEELPELKVSGQYIPRSTDELAIKARNLIKDDIKLAEKMALTSTDDAAIATGAELLKHYSAEAEKAIDETIKGAFYEKAAELGNDMAKRLTELGRSVQAASILSRLTPEGQIRFAAKTIQKYNEEIIKTKGGILGLKRLIPELTPEQVKDITESMKEIQAMPEGEQKAIRFRDLQNYISDLVPTPLYNKIVALWKAGLLTGLKTSGVNILANFSHAFGTEVIKDIPAVAVDSIVALFTGKRAVAFTAKGIAGIKEGIDRGFRFLRTGYDERNVLTKLDYRRVNLGKSKIGRALQVYEESIFKLLGAEDQPFYYGAKARSLYDQAGAQAINAGLKGAEAKAFIDNLVANPTDEMLIYSVVDAETAVFQNITALSEAAGHLRKIFGAEFIMPFTKTPSAVAMQIFNYSPVGIINTIFRNAGKGKFNQRDFSQGIGRGLVGVAILALGAYLFRKGFITLDRPKSEGERKMWELEGKKANSIKVGDKYRSVQVLGPAGNLLLIGAQFQNAFNTSGSPTEAIAKGSFGSLKAFTEQTYLTGISTGLEAFKEPERMGESFVGGLISSAVPTIVADVARSTDPKQRRAENIMQRVTERVPILRQILEPQIDILGEERMRRENFLEVMSDPTRPSTEITEPVTREIRRLIEAGQRISTTQLGDRKGYKILTQKQNTELWQRAGSIAYEKITTLMEIPAYETAPDDLKAKKIDELLDKAKLVARVEKVIEITTGLQGDDLKEKLSEAKKDGLLNREVYNLFIRMR